jgi:Uma2 family endonuclease
MTAMPAAQTMTAQEFLDLPEAQHGRPWNLVDGELVVTEATLRHQRIVGELLFALTSWTRARPGRGEASLPIDVLIDDRNVYAPDVLWYAGGHVPDRPDVRPYAVPDLAIEVRSPSTWRYDIGAKKAGYEREKLPELWLVDTAASEVLVFRRSEPGAPTFDVSLQIDTTRDLSSPLLPGFALSVERLFGER